MVDLFCAVASDAPACRVLEAIFWRDAAAAAVFA